MTTLLVAFTLVILVAAVVAAWALLAATSEAERAWTRLRDGDE